MLPAQAEVVALCASSLVAGLVLITVISKFGDGPRELLEGKKPGAAAHSALQVEIAKLRAQLDHAATSSPVKSHVRVALPRRGRHAKEFHHSTRQALDEGEDEIDDPSVPSKPYTAVARDNAAWHRHHEKLDWGPADQLAYDKAVHHAQIAEKGTHEHYEPLRVEQGYLHSSEKEEAAFETQLVDLVKLLEPSYMGLALQWAESGDTQETGFLEPIVGALEKPLIKDLDMEARVRVERTVEAIAMKHKLTLPEKEQLRAHLMAPLMMRIRARVHAQVSHYVTKMSREVVLKAANASTPGGQAYVAAMTGAARSNAVGLPNIPPLSDEDGSFVNAMHDLDTVYKEGVIDHYDYETQKAKLLSDWLKHSVNKAGGNADEVLRIVFGGNVKGVTDTDILKKQSEIDIDKKLGMEKGIVAMGEERRDSMTKDLVWQLVHQKTQWGQITNCTDQWETSHCKEKWEDIKKTIEDNFKKVHDQDSTIHWGETYDHPGDVPLSTGTKELYKHLSGDAREHIWDDQHGKVRLLPSVIIYGNTHSLII